VAGFLAARVSDCQRARGVEVRLGSGRQAVVPRRRSAPFQPPLVSLMMTYEKAWNWNIFVGSLP